MTSSSHQRTPSEVHLIVRLTLDLNTYERLLNYRAQVGAALDEHPNSFDQVSSYLLTRVLLDVDSRAASQDGADLARRRVHER